MADGTAKIAVTAGAYADAAGNTGQGAELTLKVDTLAPQASLQAATLQSTGQATVGSSESGTVYLVSDTLTVRTLADITGADGSLWNSIAVTANTSAELPAQGLQVGSYMAYALDAAGNLSQASSGGVVLTEPAPQEEWVTYDIGGLSVRGRTSDDPSPSRMALLGDMNGDREFDFFLFVPSLQSASNGGQGNAYIVLGQQGLSLIDLSMLEAGQGGMRIASASGAAFSTRFVASPGDLSGDGLADVIVGARSDVSIGPAPGPGTVILGDPIDPLNERAVDFLGSYSDDQYAATAPGQILVGNFGNDTLSALGVTVLSGGEGDDVFIVDAAFVSALLSAETVNDLLARAEGGSGIDTLRLSGTGLDLSLMSRNSSDLRYSLQRLDGIEAFDLVSSADSATLKLSSNDVLDLSRLNVFLENNYAQMLIKGGANDFLDLTDGEGTAYWQCTPSALTLDGVTYDAWAQSLAAMVFVQSGMAVI